MNVVHANRMEFMKWRSLIQNTPNTVGSGCEIYESTKELHLNDGSLVLISKPNQDCTTLLQSFSKKNLSEIQYLQFRAYKLVEPGFAGRRYWAVKIIAGKHPKNPGLRLLVVGWVKGTTMKRAFNEIKKVLKGDAQICEDPRL
ncbi:hypothetical protein PsW64_04633 [Pseudovibrio sp. W64]|uniref:hypothetical protein n=1 Tax=Pseudovibrio sp. W64 TaxID=1735583 RepID=UPI0007AE7B54|nr:hypothetical protein [Pseudovibrio sp. W64]KZK77452.1 hypothetical protein PsW64_04633 [Pseudovibrio sp. W64]